jgi:type VI secretion system protein ImpE
MQAEDLLHSRDPAQALSELQAQVRKAPSDARLRVFLFQLLAVEGRWDRALAQLDMAGQLDAGTLAMVQTYREALRCEVLREEIFAGRRSPVILGEPAQWLQTAGRAAEAQDVRDEAFAAAPAASGTIDGQAFDWLADADPRLGPMLEAIINGRYYWVPLHRALRIVIEPPTDLRDLVWMPAYFTWVNGGETVGLVPTRYPGSQLSPDPQIRLARKTVWLEQGSQSVVGTGQRLLATEAGEFPIMDIRMIEFDTGAEAGETAAAGSAGDRAV